MKAKITALEKALNLSNEIWATIDKNITKLIKADAFLKTDGKLAIQYMSAMRKKYLDGDTTADDKPTDGEPSDEVGSWVVELDDAEKPGEEDEED